MLNGQIEVSTEVMLFFIMFVRARLLACVLLVCAPVLAQANADFARSKR